MNTLFQVHPNKYYTQLNDEDRGVNPLILDINNSVDLLKLILNAEEHNLEFVEELNIAMQKNKDQYGNTEVLEFDLDELVAVLAARGTCRGELAIRGTRQVFKKCT